MQNFEKLGLFYLGKKIDSNAKDSSDNDELVLYDSKNFTTHAVILGMTGSGKTGLAINLLEEAAIDHIPSIIIDPKGDMTNLALSFPHLSKEEFAPWIDAGEAKRKNLSVDEYAEKVSEDWKEGLKKWGESAERVKLFKESADVVIYTPANSAGRPISILSSFQAPSEEMRKDTSAMRDRILTVTSSLLALLGIDADPIKSREHIMISTLFQMAWEKGEKVDLTKLIQQLQKPPFDKIGALDLDTFFPAKERTALAVSLNNLLASPGFQAWMEGEPLDIQSLLYTEEGKPKLAIMSIAHLSDSERMFFVTLLLNEIVAWMRRQSGTTTLRALIYMDEIFGFFPPTANPPSKLPMMTLLKQARAFGLGVVLSTQNPVDLDYKGLSNCGTWFIGKLQTERDKTRLLEGLKIGSNGEVNLDKLNQMLATPAKRAFILQSIYENEPIVFQTRWSLSYLRGPLTLSQIEKLTVKVASTFFKADQEDIKDHQPAKPALTGDIAEFFIKPVEGQLIKGYKPFLASISKLHFVDAKNKIDVWKDICLVAESDEEGKNVDWQQGEEVANLKERLEKKPQDNVAFQSLPLGLTQKKNYAKFEKDLQTYLYQQERYSIFSCGGQTSKEGETESEFKARITLANREKRDANVAKIREKYQAKVDVLTERLRKAQMELGQKQEKAGWGKAETFITMGTTLLGALFGKGVTKGTISQAGTSMKRVGKMGQESASVSAAGANVEAAQSKLRDLEDEMRQEIDKLTFSEGPADSDIKTEEISPRKTDISVQTLALVWWPT